LGCDSFIIRYREICPSPQLRHFVDTFWMLEEDGMDLLVRFPAGHVIQPHFHDCNEYIIVVEGQLTLHQDVGRHSRKCRWLRIRARFL
jgi:hypothetical protein